MLDKNDLHLIAELMDEKLSAMEARMDKKTDEKIDDAKEEMRRHMNVLIENQQKQIQLIAEGHMEILRRLPDVGKQQEMAERLIILEHTFAAHIKEHATNGK